MGAEDQKIRGGLFPARAQLLIALVGTPEDKPVTQQSLEGLMKRVVAGQHLVLTPGGISSVFLRKVGAGHRQRRRGILGAIDLPRIRQYCGKWFSQARELVAVESQLAGDFGDRGVRVDKPAIAEARRAAHRPVVIRGEPDRRVRLLDWPAGHCDVGQLADVVLEADIIFGPQTFDHFQTLLEATYALAARHSEGVELDIAITKPYAEDEISAPDRVERCNAFGDFNGIVQCRQQYAGNSGHLPRFRSEACQKRNQLDLPHTLAEIVLAGGDGIPPAVASQARHSVLTFERSDHVATRRMLAGEKDSDFHDVSVVNGLPGFLRS